jgi:hypothetical protein
LCKALNVDADVLTADGPISSTGQTGHEPADDTSYQLKIRLDGQARNAFSLAKLRYNVSLTQIAALAPFLFVVVAEMSLQRRRAKLEQFEKAIEDTVALVGNFPHLQMGGYSVQATESLEAEQDSIESKDIFAELLPGEVCPDWEPNPFFHQLNELAGSSGGEATIETACSSFFAYTVCPNEALALAGGQQELADDLVSGLALIHEIPRDLLAAERTEERVTWLRAQAESRRAKWENISPEALFAQEAQTNQDEVDL